MNYLLAYRLYPNIILLILFDTEDNVLISDDCFPSSGNVYLENGKSVTMSELEKGDIVQTGMKLASLSKLQTRDKVQTNIK